MATDSKLLPSRIEQLKKIWPDDQRFREALHMAIGCCDQLDVLGAAFRKTLLALPEDGTDTVEFESAVHLALTDVISWVTRMELSLTDLRQSLYFRYKARIDSGKTPDKSQEQAMLVQAQEVIDRMREKKADAKKRAAEEKRIKDDTPSADPPAPPPSKRIASLFD